MRGRQAAGMAVRGCGRGMAGDIERDNGYCYKHGLMTEDWYQYFALLYAVIEGMAFVPAL